MQTTINVVLFVGLIVVCWRMYKQCQQMRTELALLRKQLADGLESWTSAARREADVALANVSNDVRVLERDLRMTGYLLAEIAGIVASEARVMNLIKSEDARPHSINQALDARAKALHMLEAHCGTTGDLVRDIRQLNAMRRHLDAAIDALVSDFQLAGLVRGQIQETRGQLARWKDHVSAFPALSEAETKLKRAEQLLEAKQFEQALELASATCSSVMTATAN
ncbi:MAG TPA: hypothetical protein V6D17_22765 [Candidatus Obscuribacterales bacterium]